MRKTIYKTTILMLAVIFICQPLQLKADGGLIPYNYEDLYEPSQTSLIVYNNGQEDLYLKINYEGETNKFVWLVPTPSYPEASKAPKDLFKELSTLTEDLREWGKGIQSAESLDDSAGINVIVHSQENIGIYEVTVLSATGADGLFDWLNNHSYKMSEDVKEILDWYIQKEWYFTAMRIDAKSDIEKIIEEFKKIDDAVTEENVAEKYSEYYMNVLRNKDYEKFKKIRSILILLEPDFANDIMSKTENDFNVMIEGNEYNNYSEKEDWQDYKDYLKDDFLQDIKENNPSSIYKYNDYIEPIKISFSVNTIVYPLKISQFSTRVPDDPKESSKTNEVLLYILADGQVEAPGFELEYAQKINQNKLDKKEETSYEYLNSLKQIIGDKEYFLTKLRRDFAKIEMDEDLYFISNIDDHSAVERDNKRISDIKQIQTALELYYNDNNRYCDQISLGSGFNVLYMPKVPINPSPGGMNYVYEVIDGGTNYKLQFKLETESNLYSGLCIGSASGIECEDDIKVDLIIPLSQSYKNNENYLQAKSKIKGSTLSDRLKGMIVLKVEDNGEAYYINPKTKIKKYLGRPDDAFSVMRDQGIGITNANLEKIQVGSGNLTGADSDGDGLSDLFEDAISTDKNKADSDNDGYNDKAELENGYNPNGSGKLNLDSSFTINQKGKIFLQVENNGEAWYVNPNDGKRYFLGRPADAFQVMRNLGLGISNSDFEKL